MKEKGMIDNFRYHLNYFLWRFSEGSENKEALLYPGNVERLVREGREPLRIGSLEVAGEKMQPYYQVPPKEFKPELVEELYSGGCYVFLFKDGHQAIGSTYTLNEQEAEGLDRRVRKTLTSLPSAKNSS